MIPRGLPATTGPGLHKQRAARELSVPPRMLKDVSDAMTPIDWDFSVSAPAGPVIITGTLRAPTAEKVAELALEAAVQIVPGLVEATVTVQPEGVSAGVRLNLVIARFSAEMGPDGLELQLEFALDSRGAEIQAEAEMSECQPDKSARLQRQVEEPERESVRHRPLEQVLQRAELELQWQRQAQCQPEAQEEWEAGR
jgi:hypothetical protein